MINVRHFRNLNFRLSTSVLLLAIQLSISPKPIVIFDIVNVFFSHYLAYSDSSGLYLCQERIFK